MFPFRDPSDRMHRLRAICLALAFALLAPTLAVTAPASRVEIRGRVTEESGRGVPGLDIRFFQGRRDFRLLEWE